MDVHSKEIRSYNMSRIKGKNTKPELLVRKFLFSKGYRYRLHVKILPGKPDIVLSKFRTVIFVHGCFWHGHKDCKYFVIPKTRTRWWMNKINRNQHRDIENRKQLLAQKWKIIVVHECDLRSQKRNTKLLQLLNELH